MRVSLDGHDNANTLGLLEGSSSDDETHPYSDPLALGGISAVLPGARVPEPNESVPRPSAARYPGELCRGERSVAAI